MIMLHKLEDIFALLCISLTGAAAFVSSGVLHRLPVSKQNNDKQKGRKKLSIVTPPMNGLGSADAVLFAPTPRTERRGFLNHLHDLLSPRTFVQQSKIKIDKIRPLFSPVKSIQDAFKPPHIGKSFFSTSVGDLTPLAVKPALTKLQQERENNYKEIKEVALRGLVETIVFDVVSSALNEDGYMHSDPLNDAEHMVVKNVASGMLVFN